MSVLFLLLFIPNLFEIKSMQNILDSKNIIKTLFRQQKKIPKDPFIGLS